MRQWPVKQQGDEREPELKLNFETIKDLDPGEEAGEQVLGGHSASCSDMYGACSHGC